MHLAEGMVFHGIKLLRFCGSGAYGEVYYGEDISGSRLAIKVVSKSKLGDAWQRELKGVVNYRKITENASELLQIFHVEEDAETFFYTMEAADSASNDAYTPDTLAGRLQKGPLPQAEMFRILSAIFAGIKCIHDAGFAHRDIKPDNILFVKGVPKLGDIGLLSSLDATLTQIAGTMDFLPPELRAADSADLSRNISRQRNDLYAFGKVVYCTVTGNAPNEWPTVPVAQKLSLPLKFFLRFSFQLCAKDPLKRLDEINKAERELEEIERKLLYGETLRDKIRYASQQAAVALWSDIQHAARWTIHHWLWVTLFALVAGWMTWHFWPEEPFDIANLPSKTYHSDKAGVTVHIPLEWEIITPETATKMFQDVLAEGDQLPEIEKKRLAAFLMCVQNGGMYILCDYDKNFLDNITIQPVPMRGKDLQKLSDDELRLEFQQLFRGELEYETQIYEVKHLTIADCSCVLIDFSPQPGVIRMNNYMFPFEDYCVTISLTCKSATYQQRKREFASILSKMKFDKMVKKLSETPKKTQ